MKLRDYLKAATPGECHAVIVEASVANGASEDHAYWVSNKFPRGIPVGRGTCIVANDMRLIAHLFNHAEPLAELVEAARLLSDSLDGGFVKCENCGSQESTTDMDFADDLRQALAKLGDL